MKRKIKNPTMKAAFAGAMVLAALKAAQAKEPEVPKQEEIKAAAPVDPTIDAKLEHYSGINPSGDDVNRERIELVLDENDRFARAERLQRGDFESARAGLRPRIKIGTAFDGSVGGWFYGDNDSMYAFGGEADGRIADMINAGLAIEKSQAGAKKSRLFRVYAGANPSSNSRADIGYFIKNGVSCFQGAGHLALDNPNLFFGLGGVVDQTGKGKLSAILASYAKKRGEGVGFRLLGQSDFRGNDSIEAIVSLGSNYTLGSLVGLNSFVDGVNDPRDRNNINMFRNPPLQCWAKDLIARLFASRANGGDVTYSAEVYLNQQIIDELGLTIGAGWTKVEGAEQMFKALLGASVGPFRIEYSCDFGQGRMPNHGIFVATSGKKLYDAAERLYRGASKRKGHYKQN
ncbi:hypothetical protein KY340_01870 [Candidatus Woesearchaeota archaeon]|nr:hypothetical protein [Candidatus Woesearchaeota archaeon]